MKLDSFFFSSANIEGDPHITDIHNKKIDLNVNIKKIMLFYDINLNV